MIFAAMCSSHVHFRSLTLILPKAMDSDNSIHSADVTLLCFAIFQNHQSLILRLDCSMAGSR